MKRLLALSLVLGAGLLAAKTVPNGDLFGRSHGPKGTVLSARPTLVWEVWSTEPGEIVGGYAQVGNRQLAARYDSRARKVLVDLDQALAPGDHRITVFATLKSGESISKSWNIDVAEGALSELPAPTDLQTRTFQIANRFRAKIGLDPMRMDDRLNTASIYHSRYLAKNNTTGHFENPEKEGFTGREPGERHMAFGWVGNSWEAVAFGSVDEEESVQNLIDAPYHRIPFIQPGELYFGSGYADRRLTTSFSMSTETATMVYPIDRQMDVPTAWSYLERPDPLRIHSKSRRPVGYPIMLVYFSNETQLLMVDSATLKDSQGRTIDCYLNTPENDTELKNALILIPKMPLQPDSYYTAEVEAAVQNGPTIRKSWTFKTVTALARSGAGRSGGR